MRKYYTVIARSPEGIYGIRFGDYSKAVAQEEMRDMKENDKDMGIKDQYKLIVTNEGQANIMAEIDRLNKGE